MEKIMRNQGLTNFELLFTLAIMAILLTASLPDFKSMIVDIKSDNTLRRIGQAVNLARTYAIKSGGIVTVCPSDDGLQCGRDWKKVNLVFSDNNADRQINEDDQILLLVQHQAQEGTIKWRSFQNKQYLQINGLGFTRNQNGSFTYCSSENIPKQARQLVINRLGRTRYAIDTDGDGIRENSQGSPLNCS